MSDACQVEPDGKGGMIFHRRPAFPMTMFIGLTEVLPLPIPPQPRLLVLVHHSAYFPGNMWLDRLGGFDHFVECCGPQDIVWVPLYVCGVDRRIAWRGSDTPRMPAYDTHLELIRALAPRVKGIILGQMGPELCAWGPGFGRSEMLADFARHHAQIVRDAGGTPVFGTVDWDMLYDCYQHKSLLHDTMLELRAIQVCFCGFTICEAATYDMTHPQFAHQQNLINNQEHGWPHMRIREYIQSLTREGVEVISGVSGIAGYDAHNDIHLRAMGFSGGLIGVPDTTQHAARLKANKMPVAD